MLKNTFYIMLKLFFSSRTISPRKVALSSKTNPNPNPNRGGTFLRGNCPDTAFFVLEIFTFLSRFFDYVEKRIDKKPKLIFKIYDVAAWITNNCNTYLV